MRRAVALAFFASLVSPQAYAACEGRFVEGPVLNAPLCAPIEPKQIVVLDPTFSLGMGIELGLPVVGAPLHGMSDEDLKKRAEAKGVIDLGTFMEPSLEKIVALQPDLIIGGGFLGQEVYQMASSLAPTALITAADWKEYYRTVADIGGRDVAAADALRHYESHVAEVRARVPQDLKVSVVRITPWEFQVYLDAPNAYGPFAVLREAGVRRSAFETSAVEAEMKRVDFEGLAGLDGDILLYIVGGANDSATSGRHEAVLANPLWQMLPAVKAGRVHRVDEATWMEFSGAASAEKVLADIETYIVAKP